ncbi:MAG: TolC family protein [Flavobacteriales bacterium]|nr:TolC family protein [Bacteroidota bacterium]MCB9241179.1 TolC family protein [Flavobacteriales bacterium]
MKHPKTRVLISAILMLFSLSVSAQTQKMTLSQAVDYALSHSAQAQNANLDIKNSEQEVKSIVSTGLPQVNGSFNFTHNVQIASMQLPDFISPAVYGVLINEGLLPQDRFRAGMPQTVQFGAPSSLTGMVNLNQLVFDGTYFLGLKAAKQYVLLSEFLRDNTHASVSEQTQKAFFGALIAEQNVGLVDQSLINIRKTYEETLALQKAGFAEQLDVDRLKLSMTQLETQSLNLKLQRDVLMKILKVTIGMDVNAPLELEGDLANYLKVAPTATKADIQNRPEYQVLQQQLIMDSMNIKRYKVGYLPSLTLNASYQQNSFASEAEFKGLGKTWNPGTSYGFNLSIPIFDGLYKQAKLSQAKIQLEQDQNTFRQTANSLLFQAEQSKLNLQMQERTLATQKQSRDLALTIYETTLKKFNEGVATSFELVKADSDKTAAEIDYHNAIYQRLLAQIELDKSLGNLIKK